MCSPQILLFVAISLRFGLLVLAQDQNIQFNQVANLNGDMQINRLTLPDGSKIETFSQKQQQILINQNTSPLTANHVVGSTGQPFVQLSRSSMIISTDNATNLVGAQIEMPIQQATLDANSVTADNTFVAMLSTDKQKWIVMEGIKNVNTTDSTVRMIKLNSLDGEYMAIGRQTVETSNVLTPFGRTQQQTVNISGSGIQEVEFQDGFRMTVKSTQQMSINVDVVNGVSSSMLVNGAMPANNYRYLVSTNLAAVQPNLNQMMAVVQIPLNAQRVMETALRMGASSTDQINLGLEQRGVLLNPGGATGSLTRLTRLTRLLRRQGPSGNSTDTSDPTTGSNSTDPTSTQQPQDQPAQEPSNNSTNPTSTQQPQDQPAQGSSNTQNGSPVASQLILASTFTPVTSNTQIDAMSGRLAATVSQLDGEFIITMAVTKAGQAPQGNQAQGEAGTSNSTFETSRPASSLSPLVRRQGPEQAKFGASMSMAELSAMVTRQKNGGMLPVWDMLK